MCTTCFWQRIRSVLQGPMRLALLCTRLHTCKPSPMSNGSLRTKGEGACGMASHAFDWNYNFLESSVGLDGKSCVLQLESCTVTCVAAVDPRLASVKHHTVCFQPCVQQFVTRLVSAQALKLGPYLRQKRGATQLLNMMQESHRSTRRSAPPIAHNRQECLAAASRALSQLKAAEYFSGQDSDGPLAHNRRDFNTWYTFLDSILLSRW